jgi:RPA family protein
MGTEEKGIASEEVQSLRELVTKLHARVDFLEKQLERSVKTSHGFDEALCEGQELLKKSTDEAHEGIRDAFDRIKNIEAAVFPNLISDLQQLHNVIGSSTSQAECPQERKKP